MNYKDIQGWFDFAAVYDRIISEIEPGAQLVEVGAWMGKSTAYIANEIRKSEKPIKFYVVDTWVINESSTEQQRKFKGDPYQQFLENMIKTNSIDYLIPIRKMSHEAATDFRNNSLDFVFIDAAHDYESVSRDIMAWIPKIKKGGVIAGHDKSWPGVRRAIDELIERYEIIGNSWWLRT